jgi:hypothetical protein
MSCDVGPENRDLIIIDRTAKLIAAIDAGGITLDGTPTDDDMMPVLIRKVIQEKGLKRTLIVCDTHDQCDRVFFELMLHNIYNEPNYASVFPHRSAYNEKTGVGNCKSMKDVDEAKESGFSPMASVCPVCIHRKGCPYIEKSEITKASRHAIETAARAEWTDLYADCDGRDAVFAWSERSLEIIRPLVSVKFLSRTAIDQLDSIAKAAERSRANASSNPELKWPKIQRRKSYFSSVISRVQVIRGAVETGEKHWITESHPASAPHGCTPSLRKTLSSQRVRPHKDFVRIFLASMSGKLNHILLRNYWHPKEQSKHSKFLGVWELSAGAQTQPPRGA